MEGKKDGRVGVSDTSVQSDAGVNNKNGGGGGRTACLVVSVEAPVARGVEKGAQVAVWGRQGLADDGVLMMMGMVDGREGWIW